MPGRFPIEVELFFFVPNAVAKRDAPFPHCFVKRAERVNSERKKERKERIEGEPGNNVKREKRTRITNVSELAVDVQFVSFFLSSILFYIPRLLVSFLNDLYFIARRFLRLPHIMSLAVLFLFVEWYYYYY